MHQRPEQVLAAVEHRLSLSATSGNRQRANVQALLPLLATYLGHASYSDTAYYLTARWIFSPWRRNAPSSMEVQHE